MSVNTRKKLLGGASPYEDMPAILADKAAEAEIPLVDVAALTKKVDVQAQEIDRLQRELEEKSSELKRLLSVVDDRSNTRYREAFEQGTADGLKLYQARLEELDKDCTRSVDDLREFVSETVERDRQFIQENLAETVSIAVAKIIGEVRINPNYLSDTISQVLGDMAPQEKAEIQIGSNLYNALKENKVAFDRVAQLGNVCCNPDMHPFDLLIETENEVVDAGYRTQVCKLHELISKIMA